MDSTALQQVFFCFCTLSVLLLIGTFLRAKLSIFRKLFLPASVIGGFIGLLIGPIIWGNYAPIPFPEDWITIWSALPGILIVPVVASVPLGSKLRDKSAPKTDKKNHSVLMMFGIIAGVTALQGTIGLFTQTAFNLFSDIKLYPAFGYELSSGFSGGHGTAGVLGGYFKDHGLAYWNAAQGVTATTATFGLVGGILIGIIAINIAARKGYTAILSKPKDIPEDFAKGYQIDPDKQKSMGQETTLNSSIESLTFHLAIILTGCGLAFALTAMLKRFNVIGLKDVPVWTYAIVLMFGINYLIQKTKIEPLVDTKTKSRIASCCSDFAIVASIASLDIQAVSQYIIPILCMVIIGIAITYFLIRYLSNTFFDDYHVERAMACFGTCTGVFLTGVTLLKLCDPEYESPVLNDYSVGYLFNSIVSFGLMAVFLNLVTKYNSTINALLQFGVFLIFMIMMIIVRKNEKRKKA